MTSQPADDFGVNSMMMVKIIRESTLAIASALWLAVLVLGPRAATAACVGDCDGDGQVLINEIVASINIFLGTANLSACQNADQNGDGVVLINEVVAAVNSFLDPTVCLMVAGRTPTPTAPPTVTLTLSPTPTPTPTRTPTPTPPSPTATASATISSDPKATLTNIQTSIFSTTCTDQSCHSSVGQAGNLVLEPGKSHGALVNVPAFNSSAQQARLRARQARGPDQQLPGDQVYGTITGARVAHATG